MSQAPWGHWLTAVLGSNITFRPVCLSTSFVNNCSDRQVFELAIQRHSLRNCWALEVEMRSLSVLVETDHPTPLRRVSGFSLSLATPDGKPATTLLSSKQ
jgi:hypothetical protein